MTPEEAIKILEKKKEYSERIIDNFLSHSRGEIKDANETIEMCDLAISALKEIQQYREMDRKLRAAYGDCDGLLATAVEGLCKHPDVNIGKPIKARLLVDEDVDKWDAYRKIGTVEECREAREKQKPKAPKDELKINPVIDCNGAYVDADTTVYLLCPNCGEMVGIDENVDKFCRECGQAIADNLEGREDERD